MRVAERALAGCVLDRQVTGLLTDASLCHGWAGVVQALWRAASDALDPGPLQAALREARRGMEDHLARAGPPASSGLLEGTSGIHARPERPAPRRRRTARMGRLPAADPVNPDPIKEKR